MRHFVKKKHLPVAAQRRPLKSRLKVGDTVIVLTGSEKGSIGAIESLDMHKRKVVVKGVNKKVKHQKASAQKTESGIVVIYAPLPLSNVAYYDESQKKGTRLGIRIEDGKRKRFSKASGELIASPQP